MRTTLCCANVACGVPAHFWQDIRRIETEEGLVFCSETCLERFERDTATRQVIVYQVPFEWDREDGFELLPVGVGLR